MKNLRKIRNDKGLTMQQLAEMVGINMWSIFRYEHGERTPDVLTAYKIANALGVTLDELMGLK